MCSLKDDDCAHEYGHLGEPTPGQDVLAVEPEPRARQTLRADDDIQIGVRGGESRSGRATQRASAKRPLAGMGVGVAVLVLVAVTVSLSAVLAVFSFSVGGPWIGVLLVGIVLLVLALPVVAGLLAARALTASGWKIALTISALGLGLLLGPLTLSRLLGH